jgi:hypothetical protein
MMSWYQRSRFIAGSAPWWSWWLCSPEKNPKEQRIGSWKEQHGGRWRR